jgi:laminin gamma 1
LELLQTEGVVELDRAKNRSLHIDHQSEQMSDISRNSRKIADDLEKNAENNKKVAKDTRERATNASDLAKNSIELQRSITEQLKTKIVPDFSKEKKKIEALKKLTSEALSKSENVYDEALTLFAEINAVQVTEVDLSPIKSNAKTLSEQTAEIGSELDQALTSNNEVLSDLEDNINLSEVLIRR